MDLSSLGRPTEQGTIAGLGVPSGGEDHAAGGARGDNTAVTWQTAWLQLPVF
jgi:hypothetical protein